MKLYVGTSGWSYTGWSGHFYPSGLEANKYLEYYCKVFDYVEIDASFYRTPHVMTVTKWAKITPDNFQFTAKMPQKVTHEKRLDDGIESSLRFFYEAMTPLKDKLLAVLIQLPPSMTKNEGLKKLKKMPLDSRFRHAIEVRHKSWFDEDVYDYLAENDICLVWSQLAELQAPPVVTTDLIYLRFIGDRTIPDSEFGKLQIDRVKEMQYWAKEFSKLQSNKALKSGVVAANNHYAGFGPGTANIFRKMTGEPEAVWHEIDQKDVARQANLFDFK